MIKSKELAEKLLENPDFEVVFSFCEPDGSKYGLGLRRFSVDVNDIGYNNKVIVLGPTNKI